jgi:hypothetical protein
MQERRYLAAALLGAGGGGGRWSERVKSAVQNRMKERARCERVARMDVTTVSNSAEECLWWWWRKGWQAVHEDQGVPRLPASLARFQPVDNGTPMAIDS